MELRIFLSGVLSVFMLIMLPLWINAEDTCTEEDIELYVEVATDLLQSDGKKALDDIKDIRFCGNNYIFVIDLNAVSLVHIDKKLTGKNLSKINDDTGKNVFKVLKTTAISSQTQDSKGKTVYNGTGWVSYRWPKPGQTMFCDKKTFVRACKMDEYNVIVGAGIYK